MTDWFMKVVSFFIGEKKYIEYKEAVDKIYQETHSEQTRALKLAELIPTPYGRTACEKFLICALVAYRAEQRHQ